MAAAARSVTYGLLRWLTGIALHWFYSDIQAIGIERIPRRGPAILAASHHNALVDALIAVWLTPRRLTLTAKATLMDNPFLAWLLSLVGVVPLRRAADELKRKRAPDGNIDSSRNASAFQSLLDVLDRGGMVLIFPEGKSHSEPALAPLKTGLARIALEAREVRGIRNLKIVPIGLSFEDKGNPGTAVLAEVGEAVQMDELQTASVETLTREISGRLAAVSLKTPEPSPDRKAVRKRRSDSGLLAPVAAWGELTHRYIINFARDLAVTRSRNPDDPAMLTIIYSLVFILSSYLLQFTLVALLIGPLWAALFVATLPVGAYVAAFRSHPQPGD